ncbi:hypothetical protein IPG41_07185 [Candidatus Peregrinibacteria bacterium]|nr:MAG: hypothetical protein IPG41_07185 [Candidatus Peregrinibacteria bacterium]
MSLANDHIVQIFEEIADMLDVLGENVFRVRAYRRAAEVIRGLSDLKEMHKNRDADLEEIPGIGKDLHAKIVEILETGHCEMHERLMKKLSPGILDILRVRGIGPKKVKLFYEQLGIQSLEQLRSAAESGALATLPGMGEKSQSAILVALNENTQSKTRTPHEVALPEAEAYLSYLRKNLLIKEVVYAGSLRRGQSTIGDLDLLATGGKNMSTETVAALMKYFIAYPKVQTVLAEGETKSSVVIHGNLQVDFRVVDEDSFGAALFYFTGPKQFNIHVRTLALKRGLKINEYGVYQGEEKLAGKTEEEMFEALEMPYMTPQERHHFQ